MTNPQDNVDQMMKEFLERVYNSTGRRVSAVSVCWIDASTMQKPAAIIKEISVSYDWWPWDVA